MSEREQALLVVGIWLGAGGTMLLRMVVFAALDWLDSRKHGQPSPYSDNGKARRQG